MLDKIKRFNEYVNEIHLLSSCINTIDFDNVSVSPKNGIEFRANMISYLEKKKNEIMLSDDFKTLMFELDKNKNMLNKYEKITLEFIIKDYDKMTKMPILELEKHLNECIIATDKWSEAKTNNDFSIFKPYLENIINFKKEYIKNSKDYEHPYDVLLDIYEDGLTVSFLDKFFNDIKDPIINMINKIQAKDIDFDLSYKKLSKDKQEQISKLITEALEINMDSISISTCAHPMQQTISLDNLRIGTNYNLDDFSNSMYSMLHEAGHAILEANKSSELKYTYLDNINSLVLHESQSRLYENIIGRNENFIKYIFPKLKEILGNDYKDLSSDDLYRFVNIVSPSLIRTKADEVTYILHIIIRYEIEKMIFDPNINLDINDLDSTWNELMSKYLNVLPTTFSEGILQDIHWSCGDFGYFPTYAVGSILASQFAYYMDKDINIDDTLLKGDIKSINNWLFENIHKHANLLPVNDIVKQIKNEDLTSKYFIDYIQKKYTKLYNLD